MSWSHIEVAGISRHLYGCRPNITDPRDHHLRGYAPKVSPQAAGYEVAKSTLLLEHMPEVKDQGSLPTCFAFAWATLAEFLYLKLGLTPRTFAAMFLRWCACVLIDGALPTDDSGASLRSGAKALAKYGCCSEQMWRYEPSKFSDEPARPAFVEASRHKGLRYYTLSDIDWILACLSFGYPAAIGFGVFQNFAEETRKTGEYKLPESGERLLGFHAGVAYGSDDERDNADGTTGALLVRNSYGQDFGSGGDFWMSYEFARRNILMDAMCLHSEETG